MCTKKEVIFLVKELPIAEKELFATSCLKNGEYLGVCVGEDHRGAGPAEGKDNMRRRSEVARADLGVIAKR